jgi:hypothetical protein
MIFSTFSDASIYTVADATGQWTYRELLIKSIATCLGTLGYAIHSHPCRAEIGVWSPPPPAPMLLLAAPSCFQVVVFLLGKLSSILSRLLLPRASCPGFIINGHIELTPLTFPLCSGRPKCAWLLLNRWRRRRERKRERERDEREPQRSRGLPMLGKKTRKVLSEKQSFLPISEKLLQEYIYFKCVAPPRASHDRICYIVQKRISSNRATKVIHLFPSCCRRLYDTRS